MDDYDLALEQYSELASTRPYDVALLAKQGDTYLEKGDMATALAEYDKALALDPYAVWLHYGRSNVLLAMHEYTETLSSLNDALASLTLHKHLIRRPQYRF